MKSAGCHFHTPRLLISGLYCSSVVHDNAVDRLLILASAVAADADHGLENLDTAFSAERAPSTTSSTGKARASLMRSLGRTQEAVTARLAVNHSMVFFKPARKEVFARQPNSPAAFEVSSERRG